MVESTMKKNHQRTIGLIQQAMTSIGDDAAMQEAKGFLRAALSSLAEVGHKRAKRHSASEMYKEKALNKHKEWWNTVQEAAKNSAKLNINPQ
jgi:hypothetical protein